LAAAKEVADRAEGKPTQRFELSRGADRPPEFVVMYAPTLLETAIAVNEDESKET